MNIFVVNSENESLCEGITLFEKPFEEYRKFDAVRVHSHVQVDEH